LLFVLHSTLALLIFPKPLLGHSCPWITSHSNGHISYLTPLIEVFLSILKPSSHKLRTSYILTLMTLISVDGRHSQCLGPSCTLGSFGPSHQRRHKSRVSLWSSYCAHGVSSTPHGKVRNTHPYQTKLMPLSTRSRHTNFQVFIFYGVTFCNLRAQSLKMRLQIWHCLKTLATFGSLLQGPSLHWTHLLWDSFGLPFFWGLPIRLY
jgi:hypothetical protein